MGRIIDIAERAGVSTKTVSRVINGHPNISARTRSRVEEAIRALSYEPRSPAWGLRQGVSQTIGVFLSNPSAGYQGNLCDALVRACDAHNHCLAVAPYNENPQDWARHVGNFLERSQAGKIVLVPPLCDSYEVQRLLEHRDVRYALISPSRGVSGVLSIAMDDRFAAMEMTQHLISQGHRRIGFLAGRDGHVATLLRRQGFVEAFGVNGLAPPDEDLILNGDFSFRSALLPARALLDREDRPTAIFASNDEMAAAVISMASKLGLSIPGDLSVAGFDDARIARTVWPELTTIAQPYDAMAEMAVAYVSASPGEEASFSNQVLPHRLVVRASTGPCPV